MSEPTKLMMWRAVRVTPPKVPQTLADCEEGRLAILDLSGQLMIRKREGGSVRTSNGFDVCGTPGYYTFIRYLDDPQPPPPPVPTTFGELRDGQCFTTANDNRGSVH